ncbi:hypothetical protein ACIBCR_14885 [Micromonospora echinospora]|uniref:hypothetical protein n=1 Tax=Micromonospora echinospora TaxID=1877 RepID=UPI00379F5440
MSTPTAISPAHTLRGTCIQHPRYVAGCPGCRERARVRRRARYRAAAYGLIDPKWLPASDAQAHINRLTGIYGMSHRQIARTAHVRRQAVLDIAHGIQQHASPRTIAAILNVSPQRPAHTGRVPALGAARRLQGLAVAAYSVRDIARLLDAEPQCVRRWQLHTTPQISVRRHRQIAELADCLDGTTGPSPRAQRQARVKGWAPLAVWDDIDNPSDTPRGYLPWYLTAASPRTVNQRKVA